MSDSESLREMVEEAARLLVEVCDNDLAGGLLDDESDMYDADLDEDAFMLCRLVLREGMDDIAELLDAHPITGGCMRATRQIVWRVELHRDLEAWDRAATS